ncbi:MAG: carbohydrate ABC transporter permease [Clostridiales bacterium]|nr:carbohydrate ABC transporter permease [Clostridiales bacterium]
MKKIKLKKGWGTTIFLFVLAAFTILPYYIMICMGTHTNAELFRGVTMFPGCALWDNLKTVASSSMGRFYINSLIASTVATFVGTMTSAMAGFALSKYRFKGREFYINAIMVLLMVPSQISLIAYVVEMREMGLMNTLWPVIIPFSYSAFGVYWMKQSIDGSVPNEVIESARIDGASEGRLFFSIVIPYIRPAIVTIALLLFLWSWNSYLLPLITINDMDWYTVPLGVAMLNGMYTTDYAAKILALTVGTFPLIIMFIFGSKYFLRGLTGGDIKG